MALGPAALAQRSQQDPNAFADAEALEGAARDGDPQALFTLADQYEQGLGRDFDLTAAAHYMELAAERGHRAAQYRMALMLARGVGVTADTLEAYRWCHLVVGDETDGDAARDDREPDTIALLARSLCATLADTLSVEDVRAAEDQASSFVAVTGPVPSAQATAQAAADDDVDGDPVAQILARLPAGQCGAYQITQDGDNRFQLAAYAPSAAARDALASAFRAETEANDEAIKITVLAPVLCAVIALIDRHRATAPVSIGTLYNGRGEETDLFQDGDSVILDISPRETPHYVAIDYLVADGVAARLYPLTSESEHLLSAGERLRLGAEGSPSGVWEVGPPFGSDLLVILASPDALQLRIPAQDSVADYTSTLENALRDSGPNGSLLIGYRVVTIEPAGSTR